MKNGKFIRFSYTYAVTRSAAFECWLSRWCTGCPWLSWNQNGTDEGVGWCYSLSSRSLFGHFLKNSYNITTVSMLFESIETCDYLLLIILLFSNK